MSAEQQPLLHVVDVDSGEIQPECQQPACIAIREELRGEQTEKRSWRSRYYAEAADNDAKLRGDANWPRARRLFGVWKERCKHPNCRWGPDRFWMAIPALEEFDDAMIERAIEGLAYDHAELPNRNGTVERFDTWEQLFTRREGMSRRRTTANVERYANKAPYHLPKPEHLSIVCRALLWLHPDWENERIMAAAKPKVRRWAT